MAQVPQPSDAWFGATAVTILGEATQLCSLAWQIILPVPRPQGVGFPSALQLHWKQDTLLYDIAQRKSN